VNNPLDRSETMVALKRALPYIRLYKGKTFVVKTGGALSASCSSTAVGRRRRRCPASWDSNRRSSKAVA